MFRPTDMGWVLTMLTFRVFGALPLTYITIAMLADALDHVEWKAVFRADGFSMYVYTIIFTLCAGLAQGLFNFGLSATGYVPPFAADSLDALRGLRRAGSANRGAYRPQSSVGIPASITPALLTLEDF